MLAPSLLAHSPTEAAELREASRQVTAYARADPQTTSRQRSPVLAADKPSDRSAEAVDMQAGSPAELTHMQPYGPVATAAPIAATSQQHGGPAAVHHPPRLTAKSAGACSTDASLPSGATEDCTIVKLLATVRHLPPNFYADSFAPASRLYFI